MSENPFAVKIEKKKFGIGSKVLFTVISILSTATLMEYSVDLKLLIAKKVLNKLLLFVVEGIVEMAIILGLSAIITFLLIWGIGNLLNRGK